jgi:CheY-like chemotaxis protein
LAISRQFVKLHNGRIWVESKVGQGSTFHFALPIQIGYERIPQTAAMLGQRNIYDPDSQHGPILLCVTQNPAAATFLTNHIVNCRVLVVNTIEQAQEVAFTSIPQAVVLDTQDEELTRADLRQLTERWRLPNVPFLAAPLPSALPLPNRLRVDGYLVKPVFQQNLWDTLRRLGQEIEEILIVDDDPDFVRLLRGMLTSVVREYQVSAAFNGYEGLARIEQHPPDLVLLDLSMPGLTGYEVIDRIRSNPAWSSVKIVVVSAQEEIDQTQRINGPVLLGKDRGFGPDELVRWVQRELDLTGTVKQKEVG